MLRTARPLWATSARGFATKGPATFVSRTRTAQVGSASQPRLDSPSTTRKPLSLVHKTYYATKPANPEEEKKWGEAKLKPHPESVSTESSVRHLMEPDQAGGSAKPVSEGISHDLVCIGAAAMNGMIEGVFESMSLIICWVQLEPRQRNICTEYRAERVLFPWPCRNHPLPRHILQQSISFLGSEYRLANVIEFSQQHPDDTR